MVKKDHSVGARARTRSDVYEVDARPSPRPPTKRRLCGWRAAAVDVYSNVTRVSVYIMGSLLAVRVDMSSTIVSSGMDFMILGYEHAKSTDVVMQDARKATLGPEFRVLGHGMTWAWGVLVQSGSA